MMNKRNQREKSMINVIDSLRQHCADEHHWTLFSGANAHTPYLADARQKHERKLCTSLEDAITRSVLRDGMTISFHHGFREGDKVINTVVDALARQGLKNITLASSSLMTCNAPLIEHIRNGVISKIYTSGMRGPLAEAISNGLMKEPVQIHSHGGRVKLIESGEITIDVAFLGVPCCDEYGNANGTAGQSRCGSLGYAMVDAQYARHVVLLTEEIVPFPNLPASILQTQVDSIVQVTEVGDPAKISVGAARVTSNPRELMIARTAADVIEHSGYFNNGFSVQTGSGAASTACTRFLEARMLRQDIVASFALGGITGSLVDLHEKGLIETLLDTQSFDSSAASSLAKNPRHVEISTSVYANPAAKAACCDQLDIVILSALEIDLDFNVNVITGSDGVMRGASGGHCDVAAAANLTIVVAPLIRSRIPTVVRHVTTCVTPGESIDVLVTDHGIAVNPARPEVYQRLLAAGLPLMSIETLHQRTLEICGEPKPIEFEDRIVGVIRYRDGSVIDVVRQVKQP
ncbi:Citrate lyase alpha chain [Serratia fonticola]|nr:Citrate lyase alpha chain [Serratia fonticola]